MSAKSAIILGASGSVGQALLAEILNSAHFNRVVIVGRRSVLPQGSAGTMVEERLVPDMQPQGLRQAVLAALRDGDTPAVGFSVLGVGAGTAKLSLAQHRAVDVELNAAFAAGLKESGRVRHLAFMSAIGADIHASATGSGAAGMPRYARVKGEAEQAVLSHGPPLVSIFRPSLIMGSQHTPGALATTMSLLSPLIPTRYRPIRTTEIARAMVAVARTEPGVSAIYTYAAMKALVAGAADSGEPIEQT
ncbi:MAG: NAD(P)H-binding protein [Rhizobacter sp.]